jgi:hexosaminidase
LPLINPFVVPSIMIAPRLLPALLLLAAASAGGQPDVHLIPKPREIIAGDFAPVTMEIVVVPGSNEDDRFAARDLADALKMRGLKPVLGAGRGYAITFLRLDSPLAKRNLDQNKLVFTDEMKAEGYAVISAKNETVVIAASAAGIFYGAQTVKQLVRTDGAQARIQIAVIRDWPAMKYRGLHGDLSRGPVPTLEYQKKQIRTFAAYKLNVYSPYFEHTLEYKSNPLIAPPGGAMSREDAEALVAYARRYHIDVIPEQEAFGHLHHVLKYDLYSPLGETDHGHVLAPGDPKSLPLIKAWFAEIDSIFPSRFVHLGADETFELGLGRTRERVQRDSLGPVYIDFLKEIESALRYTKKRFLFWGDIAQGSPALVKSLPKDMVAVAWGYGSNPNPERLLRTFVDAGMETWVSPGVNGWNRVYPNNDVTLRNIQAMARVGQRLGSTGLLNTSWDDDGEAIFNQQWYGVLFGAAASWQPGESSIEDFQQSYGIQFHGDPTGKIDAAQLKLSAAHALLSKAGLGDGSNSLYWTDPYAGEGQVDAQKIRVVSHDFRVLAESAMVLVAQARSANRLRETDALDALEMGARRLDFIGMKFQLADEIVRLYGRAVDTVAAGGNPGHDLSEIASSINSRTQDLRDGYVLGRELFERSWRAENRPYWLYNVLNRYDLAAQLWIQRLDKVNQARAEYGRTRKLPSAESLGIPGAMPGVVP